MGCDRNHEDHLKKAIKTLQQMNEWSQPYVKVGYITFRQKKYYVKYKHHFHKYFDSMPTSIAQNTNIAQIHMTKLIRATILCIKI